MSIAISNSIGDSAEALEALEAYLGHDPLSDISHGSGSSSSSSSSADHDEAGEGV